MKSETKTIARTVPKEDLVFMKDDKGYYNYIIKDITRNLCDAFLPLDMVEYRKHMDSVIDTELHRCKRAVYRIIVKIPSAQKHGGNMKEEKNTEVTKADMAIGIGTLFLVAVICYKIGYANGSKKIVNEIQHILECSSQKVQAL